MADEFAPLVAATPQAEAAPPSLMTRIGNAVEEVIHPAPVAPAEPVAAVAPETLGPSHVEALHRERGLLTGEAIASASAAVEAASHALKVAARTAEEDRQGRAVA